jgi:hypothetical protein
MRNCVCVGGSLEMEDWDLNLISKIQNRTSKIDLIPPPIISSHPYDDRPLQPFKPCYLLSNQANIQSIQPNSTFSTAQPPHSTPHTQHLHPAGDASFITAVTKALFRRQRPLSPRSSSPFSLKPNQNCKSS